MRSALCAPADAGETETVKGTGVSSGKITVAGDENVPSSPRHVAANVIGPAGPPLRVSVMVRSARWPGRHPVDSHSPTPSFGRASQWLYGVFTDPRLSIVMEGGAFAYAFNNSSAAATLTRPLPCLWAGRCASGRALLVTARQMRSAS